MTPDSQAPLQPPRRPVGISCKKCGHFREGLAGATPRMACPKCGAVYAKVQDALDAAPQPQSLRPRPPMPARQMWSAGLFGVLTVMAVMQLFDRHSDVHWLLRIIILVMMAGAFVALMLSRPGDERSLNSRRRFFAVPNASPMRRARFPSMKMLLTMAALWALGLATIGGLLWLAKQIYG